MNRGRLGRPGNRKEISVYRIYIDSYFKAAHIVKDRKDAEMFLPKTRGCIVKDFCGKRLMETYLVSWMGGHFKWDACKCESDR